MFWVPYTATIPLAVNWPSGFITASLAVAALLGTGRVALLALSAARQGRSASVPLNPVPLDEGQEANQVAA
ncbi:MAG: hypothetical protein ABI629_07770 [bacterium]